MQKGIKEQVELTSERPYRMVRWEESFQNMELVISPKESIPVAGGGSDWHYHRAFQLTHFTQGKGMRFVGDHIAPFSEGELVLIGENAPHYWHAEGACSGLSIQWMFPPNHNLWTFPETVPLTACFVNATRGIAFSGYTAEKVSSLLAAFAESDGLARLGLLMQIFSAVAEAPSRDQCLLSSKVFSLPVESRYLEAMQAAVQFLFSNYRSEIRLEQLLEVTHMSKATFSRVFKSHFGKTLNEFLQNMRIDAVCRELSETDNPVIEIALNCGFTQVSFFNRVFRRDMKCSPTEYRLRAQSKTRVR